MPSDNKIVVASAGSRKTTYIVESALSIQADQSVLILAYTNNTLSQIRKYIIDRAGYVPPNITIQSWHSFLFSEGVKPYQNSVYSEKRIEQIFYPKDTGKFMQSLRYIPKTNINKYFLFDSKLIISERLSEFVMLCESKSEGLVFRRLESIYDVIFIDESQDLAGYDYEIVDAFLKSTINTVLVGDCRQATYFTNNSSKYRKYKGSNIIELFRKWENDGLCELIEKNECYRSNQYICDFGDRLYPELISTKSVGVEPTAHDGIFFITEAHVKDYINDFEPKILRDSVKTDTLGLAANNFGAVKGLTFNRVLIFPNGPIRKYLKDGVQEQLASITKAKFYVGITRARNSVAIVFEDKTFLDA